MTSPPPHAQCQEYGQLRALPLGTRFPMEGRQNLSSEGGSSTLRRADQVFSLKAYSTAAESSGTARITRKTGARTAVIWGTTRIARSARGRSSMESADSALRQNDAIVRS